MEPIVSSETSAIRTQTPGNYPKRNNLHLEHGESLRTRENVLSLTEFEPLTVRTVEEKDLCLKIIIIIIISSSSSSSSSSISYLLIARYLKFYIQATNHISRV